MATDWQILPEKGGFLDQEELLFEDLMTLTWRHGIIKEHIKANKGEENGS
mgnify:CR=1 FL=1